MRPKFTYTATLIGILANVMILLSACSPVPVAAKHGNGLLPETSQAESSLASTQVAASSLVTATTGLGVDPAASALDGPSILEENCTDCHLTQWLTKIEKDRAGWVNVLGQMRALGVHLEDEAREALINYLAMDDSPGVPGQ